MSSFQNKMTSHKMTMVKVNLFKRRTKWEH